MEKGNLMEINSLANDAVFQQLTAAEILEDIQEKYFARTGDHYDKELLENKDKIYRYIDVAITKSNEAIDIIKKD